MVGRHRIIVQSKRVKYDFEIKRNLTVIRGDSATGKTTLVNMIRDYYNNGDETNIEVRCDKVCVVLEGKDWQQKLRRIHDSIVFIDEGNGFIRSRDFAADVQKTDNYYVLITRWDLRQLPYSINEIYEFRDSGKYKGTKPVYNELFQMYRSYETTGEETAPIRVVTEDSNAGFQFFENICRKKGIECITAGGKSNMCKYVTKDEKRTVLMIADGAAFGPEMNEVMKQMKYGGNYALYLPESFEWLVLKSGLFNNNRIKAILESPGEYIDSQKFFSWERYFTWLLSYITADTEAAYTKERLNPFYKNGNVENKIRKTMEKVKL